MALHKLPGPRAEADRHDPSPGCRCRPEAGRVNWHGVQRQAWYHYELPPEPDDECDTRASG